MDTKNFLFEIGTEEIPAGYIAGAVKIIEKYFVSELKNYKLKYEKIEMFSTPRRMTITISNLQTKQEDINSVRKGPARNVAFDKDGNLSKAGAGFLRGAKAEEKDIYFQETPKGEYIAVKIFKKGEESSIIITKMMNEVIRKISFPKSMRWGENSFIFARPVRWLVALWDNKILPMDFLDIKTGRITFGNRYQGLDNQIKIEDSEKYLTYLKSIKVIADRNERKNLLISELDELLSQNKLKLVENKKLIDLSVDIVEYPTPILAEFDKRFLKLPEKIIILALAEHQKCFSVTAEDGKITNKFVCISNGNPEYSELIKKGNQKVVNARLADAEFFFGEDTKIKFEEFVPKLAEVTFQEKLGSLLEKTERIGKISEFIATNLNIDSQTKNNILRTAFLCKADLPTTMLGEKEFTKLQGYIGKTYAKISGENQEVCDSIQEHYLPKGKDDLLPSNAVSSIVAIADKIDTLCGICGIGMLPSGSTDPFALRRAAGGIVQIIVNSQFEINIFSIIDYTFELLNEKLDKENDNKNFVYEYMIQRISQYLKQQNIDYDIIDCVICTDVSNIPQLIKRAKDIQTFKGNEYFQKLVLGFKRVSNILSKEKNFGAIEETLLEEVAETEIFMKITETKEKIEPLIETRNYVEMMNLLVEMRQSIDNLFDNVMINVENKKLKQNRYNLLHEIRSMFLQVADISKIVVEGE